MPEMTVNDHAQIVLDEIGILLTQNQSVQILPGHHI